MSKNLVVQDSQGNIIYQGEYVYRETLYGTPYYTNRYQEVILSDTDGLSNNLILNELLALGDVKLLKGNYPLRPGVTVNGVNLDLNGSCLTTTVLKSGTAMFLMKGARPVIKNGELCGSFTIAQGEPNYSTYEGESLIGLELYEEAVIENMHIHNSWGWSITSTPTIIALAIKSVAVKKKDVTQITGTDSSHELKEFQSGYIAIPEGYRYVSLYGGIGYGYVISQKDIRYRFYDANKNAIDLDYTPSTSTGTNYVEATPRIMVLIPEGAAFVKVHTYVIDDFVEANLGFSKVNVKCLTVRNCCFHNSYALALIGMPFGITKVLDCISYGHGKPRYDAQRNTNTTGFMDVEDYCSPLIIMERCTSRDEISFALIGAYKSIISNCEGSITLYRGWSANITNCIGSVNTISSTTTVMINVDNCTQYGGSSPIKQNSPNWRGMNNTFINCLPSNFNREFNFTLRKTHKTTGNLTPEISGLVNGRIFSPCVTTSNPGFKIMGLKRGSQLTIAWCPGFNPTPSVPLVYEYHINTVNNTTEYHLDGEGLRIPTNGVVEGSEVISGNKKTYTFKLFDSSSYGGTACVYGETYGLTSTIPICANGYTIHDSVFKPTGNYGSGAANDKAWTGEYDNCTFSLTKGCMFYAGTTRKLSTDTGQLIFRNCKINNASNPLFKTNLSNLADKNYVVKFINCTIENESKLFALTPTTFNYEIIKDEGFIRTTRIFAPGASVQTITENTDYESRIKALELQLSNQ